MDLAMTIVIVLYSPFNEYAQQCVIAHLRKGILAGREALQVCRARGVSVERFDDAKSFYLPLWFAAVGFWYMMKSNLPARKIMETHTAVDELQVIYRDVLKTGEALGVSMPHFKSLKSYVDNPPNLD